MPTIKRAHLDNAINDANIEGDKLHTAYSGRGMYGETCHGISGSLADYSRLLVALATVGAPDESGEYETAADALADHVATDSFGTETIFYFPGVTITDSPPPRRPPSGGRPPAPRSPVAMADNIIPIRRQPRRAIGHTCLCGATWRPGFSSDPAWLLTADPALSTFTGILTCHCCGRRKLDVFREQAERKRAEQPPAIVVQREERPPATVTQLRPRN
jgi:hypothetical protein